MYPWFALRVRSKHERTVAMHLQQRGYEDFSPSYNVERQGSDRKKTKEQFLFPGYVFCRLDPQDRLPVLTVPGVIDLVRFGDAILPIPEVEMEQMRRVVYSGLMITPWPFLKVGQKVLIERGPLAGVEGILEAAKGTFRLVISIGLLQRSVSTEVERTWVRPIVEVNAPAQPPRQFR
jgi:transcriptional antiterminator NusG